MSDIDDTLMSSGGSYPAGRDTRYPHNCVYPGVLAFYNELDAGHVLRVEVRTATTGHGSVLTNSKGDKTLEYHDSHATQEGWKAAAAAASVPQSPITSPRQQPTRLPVHAEASGQGKWERGRELEGRGSSTGEQTFSPGTEVIGRAASARSGPVPIPVADSRGQSLPQVLKGRSDRGEDLAGGSPGTASCTDGLQTPFSAPMEQGVSSSGKPPIVGRHLPTVRIADNSSVGSSDALPRPPALRPSHSFAGSSGAAPPPELVSVQEAGTEQQAGGDPQAGAHVASGNMDASTVEDAILGPSDIPAGGSEAHVASGTAGAFEAGAGLRSLAKGAPAIPSLVNGGANVARDAPEARALPPRPTVNTRGGGSLSSRLAGDSPRCGNISEGLPLSAPSESLASAYDSEAGGRRPGGEEEWPPLMTRSGRRRLRCAMLVRTLFRTSAFFLNAILFLQHDVKLWQLLISGWRRAEHCEEAMAGQATSEMGAPRVPFGTARVLQGAHGECSVLMPPQHCLGLSSL